MAEASNLSSKSMPQSGVPRPSAFLVNASARTQSTAVTLIYAIQDLDTINLTRFDVLGGKDLSATSAACSPTRMNRMGGE
jgi:hypothetical protein